MVDIKNYTFSAKIGGHGVQYPGIIREKLVKIGAKVITHATSAIFQMAEVAVLRDVFRRIHDMIEDLRPGEPAPD